MRWLVGVVAMIAPGCRAENTAERGAPAAGTVHIVGAGVLELEVPGPVGTEPGTDPLSGSYYVGGCRLVYTASPDQTGLEPGRLGSPDDYLYRVTRIHGQPVRWATYWRTDSIRMPGEYWVAIYRPGVRVEVACATQQARDRAAGWLATVRFLPRDGGDRSGVKDITGPATFSPAPDLCTQSSEPPIGGTSVATVRIEAPPGAEVGSFELRSPATKEKSEWIRRGGPPDATAELFVPAGIYTIDVLADDQPTVRCAPVELRPGQVTTVRVQRFFM